jgi:hypothetical protein
MKYKLIAISDSDPAWNDEMDAWWNNGGALVWNQYGGMGLDSLILTEEEVQSFVTKASQIHGWDAYSGSASLSDKPLNPVQMVPYSEEDTPKSDRLQEAVVAGPVLCCQDCGRPVHPALHVARDRQEVSVPLRQLNHLLNSLQEAIEFSKGKGPNNYRTWESALGEVGEVMRYQDRHPNALEK